MPDECLDGSAVGRNKVEIAILAVRHPRRGLGGEDEAEVEITLDASQAALMDIFGFFDGKMLTAELSMRKEDRCV